MGLWQAGIHQVGPSEEDEKYFLCGAEQSVAQSFFVPLTCEIRPQAVKTYKKYIVALFTFLPLMVTVGINTCISMKLVWRDKEQDRQDCAKCRLSGGICQV